MLKNYVGDNAKQITGDLCEKRELSYLEKQGLFGWLYALYRANDWEEYGTFETLYDSSCIQNNELRINTGEGIQLDDNKRLDSIFVNKYDVLCMSVLDENDNETIYC